MPYKSITAICEGCGQPFERKHPNRSHCSLKCRIDHTRNPKRQRICAECGSSFIDHHPAHEQRYCSPRCGHDSRKVPIEDRFWRCVEKTDGCWLWTGNTNGNGYGSLRKDAPSRGNALAHRLSWEIHNGPIPEGLWVLHNCPGGDNPSCVRPSHLFLGTHGDNQRDMWAKNRQGGTRYGEGHCLAKLTWPKVREIRARYAAGGVTMSELAAEYGVTHSPIYSLLHGLTWQRDPETHTGAPPAIGNPPGSP